MPDPLIRTTVALPTRLLRAADEMVRQGRVRSRNELMAAALHREIEQLERARIDAEFASMESDGEYRTEARQILAEFADADREVRDVVESEVGDTPE